MNKKNRSYRELKKVTKHHNVILLPGRVQLKMSRQPIPKITPQHTASIKASRPRLRDVCSSQRVKIVRRLESGQTQRSVADAVGVARSVVARLFNRFQETGNVRRRPGVGRPRATTSTDDRYIQLTARRNRTENATQKRQFLLATGRRVSSQTVRNRLHEGGLYARRPMVCIPLTPRRLAARRRWDAEHRDWEQHD
ncbi:HTH_Tnp_Tc3_2 domain-containing protein [Trichonephila clavipes]|nr:HTH_Tnp_Tc3_2 domain-containing protein [Trichonephila clavipes]